MDAAALEQDNFQAWLSTFSALHDINNLLQDKLLQIAITNYPGK